MKSEVRTTLALFGAAAMLVFPVGCVVGGKGVPTHATTTTTPTTTTTTTPSSTVEPAPEPPPAPGDGGPGGITGGGGPNGGSGTSGSTGSPLRARLDAWEAVGMPVTDTNHSA